MYDNADGRFYRKADGVCYRVVDADELHVKNAELYVLARRNAVQTRDKIKFMLREFVFENAKRQARGEYRYIEFVEQVRDGADVVLVPVSYDKSDYFVAVVYKVSKVGCYKIDAEHIVIGEADTAVDYEYVVAVFKQRYVLSYFAKPAERDYAKFFCFSFCHFFTFASI
jgi:hypothetical protein